jgi:hypothetical protein
MRRLRRGRSRDGVFLFCVRTFMEFNDLMKTWGLGIGKYHGLE